MTNRLQLALLLFVCMLSAFRAFRAGRLLQRQSPRSSLTTVKSTSGRVYLNVPFEDKDLVKQKGGRWDADAKKWYYEDEDKAKSFANWAGPVSQQWLNVPFAEKDEAKARGARWDKDAKRWYAPPGANASLFRDWIVPKQSETRGERTEDKVDTGKYVLFLDVETSGLPPVAKGQYPPPDALEQYAGARAVKVSAARCLLPSLAQKGAVSLVVRADDFRITNAQYHGITDEVSRREGVPFSAVAAELRRLLQGCVAVVAHNADFDLAIVKSELHRHGCAEPLSQLQACRALCTMTLSKNAVGLKNVAGNPKSPTLRELYAYAVGAEKAAATAELGLAQLQEAFGVLVEKGVIGKEALSLE